MSLFCKHAWDKTNEVTLPSAWEQMAAPGHPIGSIKNGYDLFRKAHTLTLTCKKCGELRVIRTVNP